jgi:hypothetical protein
MQLILYNMYIYIYIYNVYWNVPHTWIEHMGE